MESPRRQAQMHTEPAADPRGPVFVHSSFRTASTWVWSKFRSDPRCLAYCEIFHEQLASCTGSEIAALHDGGWNSHHPSAAPYFLEFLPLIEPEGGVKLYGAEMAFERFLPAGGTSGTLSNAEVAYVRALIDHAEGCGRLPVLTDTRTLGRLGALKRTFGGTSILLYRNIFHQWGSYSAQAARGNGYFLETVNATLRACRHDPFLRQLDDFFHDRSSSEEDERSFLTFAALHLYLYALALPSADLVLDVNRLARDPNAADAARQRLKALTGLALDFSDCRLAFEGSLFVTRSPAAFRDTVQQLVKLIAAHVADPEVMAQVEQMRDEMLEEWERCEFYAGRTRGLLTERMGRLAGERDRAQGEADTLRAERQAARDSHATLEAEKNALGAEHAALEAERNALETERAAVRQESEALRDALREKQHELGAVHHALEEERGHRAGLEAEAARLRDRAEALGRRNAKLERRGLTGLKRLWRH